MHSTARFKLSEWSCYQQQQRVYYSQLYSVFKPNITKGMMYIIITHIIVNDFAPINSDCNKLDSDLEFINYCEFINHCEGEKEHIN